MVTHIVSVSGGVGSFIELMNCVSEYGVENTIALFADTQIEDPDLYRFLDESTRYSGAELVKIADGRNPWQVFQDKKFIGNTRVDPCSLVLKRKLIWDWIKNHYHPDECNVHAGIDFSEKHRLDRAKKLNEPYVYRSIMVEQGQIVSQQDKIDFCKNAGISPPKLYLDGFGHNNCGGFCVKAGLAQFKLLLEKYPKRYQWHVEQENETRRLNSNAKPFLRIRRGSGLEYIWLSEYRDWLKEHQLTGEDLFDWGGCGCAVE